MGNILAQDSLTLYSIQDGTNGKSAITALLTNESHVIPCDKNGANGIYTGANSTMMIYEGSTDVSSTWTVTATASAGITGGLSGRTYTITGITVDSGYVDFTATKSGYSNVTKRFNVTRTKVGATGSTGSAGQSATAYWMIVSASAIGKNQAGAFTPSTITLSGKSQTGTGAVGNYSGRFRFFINGSTTAAYTSVKDESTTTFSIPSGTTTLRCVMYQAGGVSVILDEQTVPVVVDGKNGTNGTNGTNGKTYILNIINGTRGVIYNASGTSPVPAMSAFSCELYENGTKVTPTSYSWSVPSSSSLLSGAATTSSFTPTIAGTFDGTKGNNTVNLSVTYAGQTIRDSITIAATKIGNTGAQGQVGPSGANGSNGKTYILNITGGKTTVIYNASGASPTPNGLGTFSAELYENGTKVTSGITYAWSVPSANSVLSAPSTSNTATYTPGLLASGFNQSTHYDNTISLTVTYAGQTIKDIQPIAVSRIGNTGNTGAAGTAATVALLSNEAHAFSANTAGQAIATSVSTAVYAYKGTTQVSTKIGTITGLPTGMTASIAENETTKASITFSVTSSLTTTSGVVNIPITANGITFNKQFSYALAKQGATGSTGNTGQNATAYWLVVSAAAITKNISGTYTPASITLTGKSKTGNSSPGDYSGRFQIFLNGSTTASYTSSANEATKAYTVPSGTTSIKCVMYQAGGTTIILDEQIIPIVSDGKTGATGSSGVSVTSIAIQYAVSTSNTTVPSSWSTTMPTRSSNQYLWVRDHITFSNGSSADVGARVVTGDKGDKGNTGDKGATGSQGISISSVVSYFSVNSSKTTAPDSGWQTTPPTRSAGQFLWRKDLITYSNNTTAYTTPVMITGDKGDTGAKGVGVASVDVWYYKSTSATSVTGGSWATTSPAWENGKYIWSKTIITYTDSSTEESEPVCITGQKGSTGTTGATGKGVSSIVEQYYQSTSTSSQTGGSWGTTVPAWADGKYIWTRSIITYTDGTSTTTTPICVTGSKGATGSAGKGVSSIVEQYYLSTSATSQAGGSWSATVPSWSNGKYMWTRSVITYTDSSTSTTSPVCVTGAKGSTGASGTNGVSVTSVDVQYYKSTSSTSLSGGSWVTDAPAWENGKYIWSKTVVTFSNGTTSETDAICITGAKGSTGSAGRGISTITEYYLATPQSSGITTSTSGWTTTIPTISATNKYLWNYEVVKYTDNNSVSTAPKIIGAYGDKGNNGSDGKGIKSTAVTYQASTSGTTTPTGTWSTTIPSVTANQYLWTRTILTYTDNSTSTSYSIGKMGATGATGATGKGVKATAVTYQASTSGTTVPTGTWATTIPSVSANQYLWTRTVITYTDNTTSTAYSIGKMGATGATGPTGATGNGIKTIVNYYLASASSSGVTTSTSGWTTTIQTITASLKYLWNYEVVTYTNNSSYTSTPVIIGAYGNTGATGPTGATGTGYTLILSNENHTFPATTSAAIAGSASTNVIAYKNATQVAATISKIGSTAVSGNQTGVATGVTGLTADISGNGTTSAAITFKATTSLTSKNGTIAVTMTVDGKSFIKNFSFALAMTGSTGATGNTGAAAKSIDITASSQVFKSTDGGMTFSPDTIKLSPIFQGGISFSKWQYSINGGTSWVDVASGSNGLTIASGVLTVAKTCSLFTKSISTLSFKCISNNASYFDIISILKLYDVTDIHLATRNLLLNSGVQITNSSYLAQQYSTSSLTANSKYTIVLKGKITSPNKFGVWCNNGSNNVGYFSVGQNNAVEYFSFTTPSTLSTTTISIYNYPSSSAASATIYWAALYEGDVIPSLDWTPAPEDADKTFTEIRTTLSGVSSKVNAVENKITNKVWQSDITDKINNYNNTTIKTLTDRVTKTETDITGIRSTVSEVQTTVSKKADSTTVTTLTNRVSAAEQNINGFKTTVSETYATKTEANEITEHINSVKSSFEQTAASISSQVEDAYGRITEMVQTAEDLDLRVGTSEDALELLANTTIPEMQDDIRETAAALEINSESIQAKIALLQGDITSLSEVTQDIRGFKLKFAELGMYDEDDIEHIKTITWISKDGIRVSNRDPSDTTSRIAGNTTLINDSEFAGYVNDGSQDGDGTKMFELNKNRVYTNRLVADNGIDLITMKILPSTYNKGAANEVGAVNFIKAAGNS